MDSTMEWHPTDDDLVLEWYGDPAATDGPRTSAHLAHCEPCQRRRDEIVAVLALVDTAEPREAPADFEDAIWSRIAAGLPEPRRRWTMRQLVPLGAWAAAVVAAVATGLVWNGARPSVVVPDGAASTTAAGAPAEDLQNRVLLTALDEHFGQTEMLLVELLNAPAPQTGALDADTFAFERRTADDLVSSGRLYRETAREIGQRQFADVLDDLESVLVEVARSPAAPPATQVDTWRSQIEDHGLLFKVRAATNEIRERQSGTDGARGGAL